MKDRGQWGPIDAKILYMSFWFKPIARSGKTKWAAAWPNVDGFFSSDRITWVWQKKEMEARGTKVIDDIILNDKMRRKFWQAYQKALKNLDNLVVEILKSSPKELASYAKRFYDYLTTIWDYGISPELANYAAPAYLKKKLAAKFTDRQTEEILEALLATEHLSFHQQSELELLETAQRNNSFKEYAAKWYWVENGYFESKILTDKYFKEKVKDLSFEEIENKINKIKKYPKQIRQRKQKVAAKYKISTEFMAIADKLAFSIWWQDHRKAESLRLHSIVDILSQNIVKKLKIDFDDIMYYTAQEWSDIFYDKSKVLSKDSIRERKKLSFFEISTSRAMVREFQGQKAKDRYDFWGLSSNIENVDSSKIKGIAVSRGKISGRARVLLSHRQSDKMKQGEILIAPMTSPDYIVAMRKAKAIVTDVGGLMSHAAIIARELGIPCVVGTKIATQVLKDGDMLEVDAEYGIVRKLNI